ncbi:MAG: hypothetical protein COA45_08500 [Zetaproteobacteria bacterium]|nr:MAG: hypothetical protein COA45_08500 [Zetaproteobacteria bacterium]
MTIKTSLIVAMANNRCIGKDNQMPWHISDDLKRFKALTTGHPMIMGRKTFESILGYLNKPLPGRTNIVISRSGFDNTHNVPVFSNIEHAINHAKSIAREDHKEEIFIIGGAQIYTQSIQYANRIHLTKVHRKVDGDAFFPEFNDKEWLISERIDNMDNDPPYSFITLERQ